jgi:hypothetical protein
MTMPANPRARTEPLTLTPGLGSARRAGPIGVSGEAATATTTASAAPDAIACGRIARSAVASCVDWSATNTCLPVAGYPVARSCALALSTDSETCGLSFT